MKHDLFLELDMFNSAWQVKYDSLAKAAKAAGVSDMYQEWLTSDEGKHYSEIMESVPDTLSANALARKVNEAWNDAFVKHQGYTNDF